MFTIVTDSASWNLTRVSNYSLVATYGTEDEKKEEHHSISLYRKK
jgi:hypothetical protein